MKIKILFKNPSLRVHFCEHSFITYKYSKFLIFTSPPKKAICHLDWQTFVRLFYSSLLCENHGITNSRMHLNSKDTPHKKKRLKIVITVKVRKKVTWYLVFSNHNAAKSQVKGLLCTISNRLPVGISMLTFMFHENTSSIPLNCLPCWLLFSVYFYFTRSREAWNQGVIWGFTLGWHWAVCTQLIRPSWVSTAQWDSSAYLKWVFNNLHIRKYIQKDILKLIWMFRWIHIVITFNHCRQ